jgi:hypothetical protein
VDFKELGTFKQSSAGEIEFDFSSENNLLPDSFGLSAVSVLEKNDVVPPQVKPEKKAPLKKKPVKKEPVKKVKPKVERSKKTRVKKEKKTGEKKKIKVWSILLILFMAIGIALATIYFFKPDLWTKGYNFSTEKIASVKQMFNKDSRQYDIIGTDKEVNSENVENDTSLVTTTKEEEYTDEDNVISDDENVDTSFEEDSPVTGEENVAKEEVVEDAVVEDNTPEDIVTEEINTSVNKPNKGKYYIIVGSVKTEASAKREQKRFSKKGITTSIIYVTSNNRYRISLGEFSSAKQAQNFYFDIQSKHGNVEAWVWENR